ncbi:MAG: MmcQ/YjbR family DNA-binding protein [Sphingobacteriaceae bacterium]
MDIETLRDYCLSKKGVTESLPFGPDALVFKVGGKMFLLTNLQNPDSFNAKCDPERAIALREEFEEIVPGYHMSKVHWNTVSMTGRLTLMQLQELIDHSYVLVYEGLPKKLKEEISQL